MLQEQGCGDRMSKFTHLFGALCVCVCVCMVRGYGNIQHMKIDNHTLTYQRSDSLMEVNLVQERPARPLDHWLWKLLFTFTEATSCLPYNCIVVCNLMSYMIYVCVCVHIYTYICKLMITSWSTGTHISVGDQENDFLFIYLILIYRIYSSTFFLAIPICLMRVVDT